MFTGIQDDPLFIRIPCQLKLRYIIYVSGVTSYFDSEGDIRDFEKIRRDIRSFLIGAGMMSPQPMLVKVGPPKFLSVLIDGHVVGSVSSNLVEDVVANLRRSKVSTDTMVCPC